MHDDDDRSSPILGRRQILRGTGLAAGVLALSRLAGANPILRTSFAGERLDLSDLVNPQAAQGMCVLTPPATAGPFYLNLGLVRSDIRESQRGLQTRLNLNVVRASDCAPLPNARVEVWHTHAPGRYSGFASRGTQGTTWLRGTQFTDANGAAFFDTIYPGWYTGRTPHIHLKVQPSGGPELTTQMYFPDSLSRRIYRTGWYSAHGPNPVRNGTDGFFRIETLMTVLGTTTGKLFLPGTMSALLGPTLGQLQLQLTIGVA